MTMKSSGPSGDLRQSMSRHQPRNQTVRSPWDLALVVLCMAVLGATNAVGAINQTAAPSCGSGAEKPVYAQEGLATWYGGRAVGHRTASGEVMARHALTAAHRTLPFGSIVRVTNLENCRAVNVTINDRGPSARRSHGRIIDISKPAALALGITKAGVAKVRIEEFKSAPAMR